MTLAKQLEQQLDTIRATRQNLIQARLETEDTMILEAIYKANKHLVDAFAELSVLF